MPSILADTGPLVVLLADATGVDSVLTIDSDFQIYRLKNARPLVDVLRR